MLTHFFRTYPELRGVGLFTSLYLLVAGGFAAMYQNWEFVFYIGVVVILMLVVIAAHKRAHLSRGVLWALSVWGLLHMIGGLVPVPEGLPYNGDKGVFYSLWIIPNYLKYDHIVHAFGFGISTMVCWQALRAAAPAIRPSLGVISLCMLGGMGLGATNEIVEFVAVLAIPDTNVGGYINTGWDLVSNATGCVIAGILIRTQYA